MKLLGPGPLQTSSRDAPVLRPGSQDAAGVAGVQMEAGLSSGRLGDATNAAAAAAAAVAAAAPLIKVDLISDQFLILIQQLLHNCSATGTNYVLNLSTKITRLSKNNLQSVESVRARAVSGTGETMIQEVQLESGSSHLYLKPHQRRTHRTVF